MKYGILLLSTIIIANVSLAQRKKPSKKEPEIVISLDTVATQCQNLPMDQRPRITVARFSVSSPRRPSSDFGDNLATMLTNYLQEVQCFRVLEQLNNMTDLTNEINQGGSQYADKSSAISTGKMLTANIIATGEVTRYEVASNSQNIMGVAHNSHTASLAIVFKLVNPATREVISSRTFSADKETSAGMSVGIGYVHFSNKTEQNPALQMAAEEVIKRGVIFLSGEKDKVNMPGATLTASSSPAANSGIRSTLVIKNIDYQQLSKVAGSIEKISGVTKVNSDNFDNNEATIYIDHTMASKALLDKILAANTGVKLSVQSVSKDNAVLVIK